MVEIIFSIFVWVLLTALIFKLINYIHNQFIILEKTKQESNALKEDLARLRQRLNMVEDR